MNLIGRKIRGFKFETKGFNFYPQMEKYIGELGVITRQNDKVITVQFLTANWNYPLPQAVKYLEKEEPMLPKLEGVLMEVSNNSLIWSKQIVFGIYKGRYITNAGPFSHARPINQVKKLTMEELEKIVGFKFEIINDIDK